MEKTRIKVGAGKGVIRFPLNLLPLEGFNKVYDYPGVRILLFENVQRFAIVSVEIVMLPQELITASKNIICQVTQTPVSNIWLHVTHAISTPHEPRINKSDNACESYMREAEAKRKLYSDAILDGVRIAATEAMVSLQPAVIGIGTGLCEININRDIETPKGWWIGLKGQGPSNKTMSVLRVDSLLGKPIGFIISYGIKPCALDNSEMEKGTRLISADLTGEACRLMEKELGAPTLFCMSAAGDQIPLEQAWYDDTDENGNIVKIDKGVERGLQLVKNFGAIMAHDAIAIANKIEASDASPIKLLDGCFQWPGKEREEMKPKKALEIKERGLVTVDIRTMSMGDIAFVGVKPEINCITELELHELSPFKNTFLISMVDGGMKYMPDFQSYKNATWEAQNSGLIPGSAEQFVKTAVQLLDNLKKMKNEEEC